MVLVSTGSKTRERDGDGNTAEVLAMNAEYENCREVVVVAKIREFRMRRSSGQKGGKRGAGLSVSTGIGDKYSSFDDVTATVIGHGADADVELTLSDEKAQNALNPMSMNLVTRGSGGAGRAAGGARRRAATTAGSSDEAPSASGSTWTTRLDRLPPQGQLGAVHSGRIVGVDPSPGGGRSVSTPRGFGRDGFGASGQGRARDFEGRAHGDFRAHSAPRRRPREPPATAAATERLMKEEAIRAERQAAERAAEMAAAANAERLMKKETVRAERLLKEEAARRAEEEARLSGNQQRSASSSEEVEQADKMRELVDRYEDQAVVLKGAKEDNAATRRELEEERLRSKKLVEEEQSKSRNLLEAERLRLKELADRVASLQAQLSADSSAERLLKEEQARACAPASTGPPRRSLRCRGRRGS